MKGHRLKEGLLLVKLIEGKNFIIGDVIPQTSDPYCRFYLERRTPDAPDRRHFIANSRVEWMTLNPTWNESFCIVISERFNDDKDLNVDGHVQIGPEFWDDDASMSNSDSVSLTTTNTTTTADSNNNSDSSLSSSNEGNSDSSSSSSDNNSSSNNNGSRSRSSSIMSTHSNSAYNNEMIIALVMEFYDRDRFKKDDFLGACEFQLNQLEEYEWKEVSLPLLGVASGEVRFSLMFRSLTQEGSVPRDVYGFNIEEDLFAEYFAELKQERRKKQLGNNKKQSEHFGVHDDDIELFFSSLLADPSSFKNPLPANEQQLLQTKNLAKLKKATRLGIVPGPHRGELWFICTGAKKKQRDHPASYYTDLVSSCKTKQCAYAAKIERDVDRTFPDHVIYQTQQGKASLRQLLLAYSEHNPSVGYRGAMNFIAAMLLLLLDEESAFWVLDSIVQDLLPDYFTSDLIGAQVDQRVFQYIFEKSLPDVDQHIKSIDPTILSMVTTKWFISLYLDVIPAQTVVRIWDVFFLERSFTIFFKVGLALMLLNKQKILECRTMSQVYPFLKAMSERSFDSTGLLKVACSFNSSYLTESVVQEAQQKTKAQLAAEYKRK